MVFGQLSVEALNALFPTDSALKNLISWNTSEITIETICCGVVTHFHSTHLKENCSSMNCSNFGVITSQVTVC
jgi:hypothetical protein